MDKNDTSGSAIPKSLADVRNTNENRSFSGLDFELMKDLFKKSDLAEAAQILCGSPLSSLDFQFSQNPSEEDFMIDGNIQKNNTESLTQSTSENLSVLVMPAEQPINVPKNKNLLHQDLAMDSTMTDYNAELPLSNSSSPSLMPETFDFFRAHCQSPCNGLKDDDLTDCDTPVKLKNVGINFEGGVSEIALHDNSPAISITREAENMSPNPETEFDDSDADPNYENHDLVGNRRTSSSSSEIDSENAENIKPKTRKRKANPDNWERNKLKLLRNSGQEYKTLKNKLLVPSRVMGPPCPNSCRRKCTQKFTEDEREEHFRFYWNMKDINKQRQFVSSSMKKITPKNKNDNHVLMETARVRKLNNMFFLWKADERVAVCKRFFTSTLGITNRCIRTVIEKTDKGVTTDDLRGRHDKHPTVSEEMKDIVRRHFSSIPTIESHYTRANSTKNYIEGGRSLMDLYRDYKQDCQKENRAFVSFAIYRQIFNYEFNLEFFQPKKDLCQFCESYKNKTHGERLQMEVEYMKHHEEKTKSRTEKENDKAKVSKNYRVACFDLQAALPTPKGEVSTFYYKSKLSTYNFTICDLNTKGLGTVHCYVWHEGEGHKGANEIGSCLVHYLRSCASKEDVAGCSKDSDCDDVEIVLYSDNCGGQGKNKFIIAAYLYAVSNFNIKSITQKFLVVGHTQNEGDVSHSLIEKNIKKALKSNPIYLPSQYATLISTARKSAQPFKVHEIDHDFFFDLKDLVDITATNFNVNTEGDKFNFNDICMIRVEKDYQGVYHYKTSYKEESYKTVNIISRTRKQLKLLNEIQLKKAYPEKLSITQRKYNDLISLVRSNTIPSC